MTVLLLSAKAQSYGWLAVVAAVAIMFAWKPTWPHAVARLPLLPGLFIFVAYAAFVVWFVQKRSSWPAIVFGILAIALYFHLQFFAYSSILVVARKGLAFRAHDLETYLAVSTLNVLHNMPVILTFAVLEIVLLSLDRLHGSEIKSH
jgi:hypothetical protein